MRVRIEVGVAMRVMRRRRMIMMTMTVTASTSLSTLVRVTIREVTGVTVLAVCATTRKSKESIELDTTLCV